MFGISETELVLIVLFAFMIFGPDKLPGMGRTIGRALRQFKNAQEGFTEVVQTNIVDPGRGGSAPQARRDLRRAQEATRRGEGRPRGRRGRGCRRSRRGRRHRQERRGGRHLQDEREAGYRSRRSHGCPSAPTPSRQQAERGHTATGEAAVDSQPKPKPSAADLYAMGTSSKPRSAGSAGENPVASREASEAQSAERRADGALPGGAGADNATDETKEA